jgi:hypothetical protein
VTDREREKDSFIHSVSYLFENKERERDSREKNEKMEKMISFQHNTTSSLEALTGERERDIKQR